MVDPVERRGQPKVLRIAVPAWPFAFCLLLCLMPAHGQVAGNWTIQPPLASSIAAAEPVVVTLPAGLSPAQLASLAVEVDNVDVTALTQVAAGKLTYSPPQPFESGPHELRVVEYAANGQLQPRGRWSFSAIGGAKGTGARTWFVRGSVGGTLSERVMQSDLTPPAPSRFTANGTFDVKAARTMSEWTAEATVNGMIGTDNGTSELAGHGLQPAQIQFALRHGKDNVILGDQTLPYDNLLISGLARRGLSGHLEGTGIGLEATAFALRDSSVAGFYGGMGVGDPNDNVTGALVQEHPFVSAPKALVLTAAFVTGTSPGGLSTVTPYPGGNGSFPPAVQAPPFGTVSVVQSGSGSGWTLGASSEVPHTALGLNAQYAGSSFDFPGTSGQADTRASDKAWSGGANYRWALDSKWSLGASASYQSIGTFFTSLANPTLVPDRRTANGGFTLNGAGLVVAANGGFTQDNVDDNADVATVRSLPRTLSLSYGPVLPVAVKAWLGTPSLSLAHQDTRSRSISAPAGSAPTLGDVVNNTASFNFGYDSFSWLAGWTEGSFRDATGQQDDTDTRGPNLGLTVKLGGTGSIGLNVQSIDTFDIQQGTHAVDHNYALNASDNFFADRLTAQLGGTVNHNTQQIVPGSIPPQLTASVLVLKTATAQLLWHALVASPQRAGLDIGLSCSWNGSTGLNSSTLTAQGFSALATRGYQTFLTIGTRLPLDRSGP